MKSLLIGLVVTLCSSPLLFAQDKGKTIEGLSMNSLILGEKVNYAIYLPPDYETSNRYYPVVYLLHGYTDDESGWIQFGEINTAADAAIKNREIPPMIIVMPDAKVTWYVNDYEGKKRYEDMFFEEFIPFIEKNNRIRAKKEFRGITGLSMGGYGSLLYAMKHPDMFAASAPLSAAIFSDESALNFNQETWDNMMSPMFGKGLKGKDRLTKHWNDNNVFYLLENGQADDFKKVRYYFDCGDDDFLSQVNCEFHIKLGKKEIPHEFRMRDGEHNWTYWRTGIVDALAFIGESFHR